MFSQSPTSNLNGQETKDFKSKIHKLNAILQKRKAGLLGETADSRPSQGRYKMSLDISLSQEARKYSNTNGDMSKGHRSSPEGTFSGHIWDNLSIKKNSANGLTYSVTKEFHESIVIFRK